MVESAAPPTPAEALEPAPSQVQEKPIPWVIAVAGLLFLVAFLPLLAAYWKEWNADHSPFGFGYFVPFSVIYLVWANRARLAQVPIVTPGRWAWAPVAAFSALQGISLLAGVHLLQGVALIGLMLSLAYWVWGPARFRLLWAPLVYTATMIPWPGEISNQILFRLQHFSVIGAAWFFRLIGWRPSVDAAIVTLPHYRFEVAPSCAGLTILFPTVACAILTVIMLDAKLWRKLLYVLLAVPVSIFVNTTRIVLVGVLGNLGGTELATRLHDASGLLGVVICVLILALIGACIGCSKYQPQYMPGWAREQEA